MIYIYREFLEKYYIMIYNTISFLTIFVHALVNIFFKVVNFLVKNTFAIDIIIGLLYTA